MFAPAYYQDRLSSLPQIAVGESDYRIIKSTREFKERLLELIRSATTRIYMAALYLEADGAGEEILRALFEAQQANPALDIQIFVDFHRAQRGRIGEETTATNRDFYQRLTDEYEHPIKIFGVPVKGREIFGVLHLKGFVFDNTVLYSGASINDVYLHHEERYRYDRYHEMHSRVLSDSFAEYMTSYFRKHPAVQPLNSGPVTSRKALKHVIRNFGRTLRRSTYSFAPDHDGTQIGLTPVCGMGARGNRLNKMICNLLRSAEKEVFICTPYFNPPRTISRQLNQLLKRHVKVTIVVGDKTANDFYIPPEEEFSKIGGLPYLYEYNLRSFARRHQKDIEDGRLNLMLWKSGDNSYHLKGIYADGNRALVTGSNLNPRAWGLDLENGVLVQDMQQKLQTEFVQEQELILSGASRINNYRELDKMGDYPDEVQRLLGKIKRFKAHVLIKKII
ncbi:CDP-diacylglycerol--serine O-phosphatidyltransferase [Sansalvadorimonas sp. 2012CJ34-2]|uniref:CDP-diacylglycerol--serine O-phosphatidyltransferase n=1 Tax=Parendozoicomonas callyspongiae TaxID=2942213 RepID=A0ABT0PE42_9GAMM|nr:CDP-diacylglycerol--serine O-phosphatidyltransferase [Sansalvadorimonas sp. 2012CJ34-2]MCL6269047.1 CDP-diacylglycerol--serine O-phosphatidyltransferase [Sansalvadorimonas sp. 2012CJ34-2]